MLLRKLRVQILNKRDYTNSPAFNYHGKSTCITRIDELLEEVQQKKDIIIQGWVRRYQKLGKTLFLKINDGTTSKHIQAVLPRTICSTVSPGSAIQLHGQWAPSPGPEQNMEFLADRCIFIGHTNEPIPAGDNDNLRSLPHLRPKALEFAAILRMRSRLTHLTHKFFNDRSFIHVDTPLLSQNDCEGAGEAFGVTCPVGFFEDTQPYLPVSAQLHLEAISSALPRVYTLSPAFRANPSTSRQHLAEFRMLEVECAFMDSLDQLCSIVEDFLRFTIDKTYSELAEEFNASEPICQRSGKNFDCQILAKCLTGRLDAPLPKITFLDAVNILGRSSADALKPLNRSEEMQLVNTFQGPVFITHFPSQHKPFYMRQTEDGRFTESFDLLAPFVGELAGGSVREWDPELLASRIPQRAKLDWYLDLRRWGYPRSVGFGVGMDRLMQSLFGIVNIKDTIPFPRWSKQALKC